MFASPVVVTTDNRGNNQIYSAADIENCNLGGSTLSQVAIWAQKLAVGDSGLPTSAICNNVISVKIIPTTFLLAFWIVLPSDTDAVGSGRNSIRSFTKVSRRNSKEASDADPC